MELWHAWACPYCMRVRIALAEKGLRYEEREIDLAKKPPELLAVNSKGGVPVLVIDGKAIPESWSILSHLEERFPEPPLMGRDEAERSRARLLYDRVTSELAPHLPRIARGTPEEQADAEASVREALCALEAEAPDRGFLAGDFSIADVALATMVMKLPERARPSALGLPRLARWEAAVLSRPSIAFHTAPARPR